MNLLGVRPGWLKIPRRANLHGVAFRRTRDMSPAPSKTNDTLGDGGERALQRRRGLSCLEPRVLAGCRAIRINPPLIITEEALGMVLRQHGLD